VAEAMFGDPLMAHGTEIFVTAAPPPGAGEREDGSGNGEAPENPEGIHREPHELRRKGAVCIRFRFHISPHATQRQ